MWNVQQSHITLYKQVLRIIFIIYIVNTQNAQVFSNTFMNAVFDNGIQKFFLVYCYCYLPIIQNYTPLYISFVILCYVYLLFSSNIIICETEKCKQKNNFVFIFSLFHYTITLHTTTTTSNHILHDLHLPILLLLLHLYYTPSFLDNAPTITIVQTEGPSFVSIQIT